MCGKLEQVGAVLLDMWLRMKPLMPHAAKACWPVERDRGSPDADARAGHTGLGDLDTRGMSVEPSAERIWTRVLWMRTSSTWSAVDVCA